MFQVANVAAMYCLVNVIAYPAACRLASRGSLPRGRSPVGGLRPGGLIPSGPYRRSCGRLAWPSDAGEAAALGFPFIGLNPERHVGEVRTFAAVHGQHDRTVTGSPGLAELKQGPGDIGDQLSIPPPGFWLVWG
jgi:hypothetical protein